MNFNYLTNTPLDRARSVYQEALVKAGCNLRPTEIRSVRDAGGLITASPVYARRNVPHFLASAMDGIAVRASDTFGATETTPVILSADRYSIVDTGDPIPADYDSVVMIEDIVCSGHDEPITLYQSAVPWQHIRQIGEDFCAGDMLLTSGTRIEAAATGLLLAGGVRQLEVFRQLLVAIIPSGDEIVPADQDLHPGEIPEYNAGMLAAALADIGVSATVFPIVPDQPEIIRQALTDGLAQADLVLLLAGSSAGRDDYSSQVIAGLGKVIIHGLAIKPGKPAILAVCDGKPVIGMPGYPVSTLMVFERIIIWLLRSFSILDIPERPSLKATLSRKLLSSLKYEEYIRVRLNQVNGQWICIPMERGAGLLNSFLRADGIVTIDQNCEGLAAGSQVDVELLRDEAALAGAVNLVGSHDPLLDELAELFHHHTGRRLSSTHVGSLGGLMALKRQETRIAPVHLLDPDSGEYNWFDLERLFPDQSICLIEGVQRVQGLMVKKGNPFQIASVRDLAGTGEPGIRYVNRQQGAGTRVLFDYLLAMSGIRPEQIQGYEREENTHNAVAAQIAEGSADVGMGILAAARVFDLDFIALTQECYDFAIPADQVEQTDIQNFIALLNSPQLARRLEQMGGYILAKPGRRIDRARSRERIISL